MTSHSDGSIHEPIAPMLRSRSIRTAIQPSLYPDRILALADALEQGATPVPGFDMSQLYVSTHSTGRNVNRLRDDRGGVTAGLEAHVVTFFSDIPVSTSNVHGAAMQLLGLTAAQAEALFRPAGFRRPGEITRAMAVAALRRLAATGKVCWFSPN